jgi:hypothetical protein
MNKEFIPYEQAKELVDKMSVVGLQMRNEGIQCALIAVEFAREQFYKYCSAEVGTVGTYDDHFNVLKKEIENL